MNIKKIESIRNRLGDNEDSRLFTDEEIEAVLESTKNDNLALYHLYLQKAGKLITAETYIKSIKAGNENLERLTAKDLQEMALLQAENYKKLYELEVKLNEESMVIY